MNVDNFRLQIGGKEYVPIIIGGMGVNISTTELAVAAEKLGGIGHISDAIAGYVCDRIFNTSFISRKRKKYAEYSNNPDKSAVQFDLEEVAAAQKRYIDDCAINGNALQQSVVYAVGRAADGGVYIGDCCQK